MRSGVEVEDGPHLVDVGARRGPRPRSAVSGGRVAERPGGIPDPGGEVADDQDREVSEILELAQFVQNDRMAEVDVGRGRVDAELHPQRPARSSFVRSSSAVDAVDRARGQDPQLLVHRRHRRTLPVAASARYQGAPRDRRGALRAQ